jgi:malate synthase
MGGMAAQIPIKNDPYANSVALEKVRKDKERDDGTWVAHPALVPVAMEIFDRYMPTANQINVIKTLCIKSGDLLKIPMGKITEAGLRNNINVAVQYLDAWINGNGCVPLYNLMEDAATAEISRSQIWQWLKHKVLLENSEEMTADKITKFIENEFIDKFPKGVRLFKELVFNSEFVEFLTSFAYHDL